jgi:hypothetical protein
VVRAGSAKRPSAPGSSHIRWVEWPSDYHQLLAGLRTRPRRARRGRLCEALDGYLALSLALLLCAALPARVGDPSCRLWVSERCASRPFGPREPPPASGQRDIT